MKINLCHIIGTFIVICSVVFFVNISFGELESTKTQGLRDKLTENIIDVTIQMGVLRDIQNEMWRLKSSWSSCQYDLRELGLNKLGDVAQLDVVNTIVKMWHIIPQQTKRKIDYARSLNSYMSEAIGMVETQLFYTNSVVELYDTAWSELSGAVWGHNYSHTSPSETNHSVPKFVSDWKYRSDFPSFLCAGDCNDSFITPASPHYKICGNDTISVKGCSKSYFSCIEEKNNRHKVIACGKWVWKRNISTTNLAYRIKDHVCGVQYRNCTISKAPHYWELPTKHNNTDDDDDSADNTPPSPTMHACGVHESTVSGSHTSTTPPCGVSAHANYACQITSTHKDTVSCPKDSNNQECTYQTYYACSEHVHAYPTPPAPPTVSCGRSACVESVSSSTEHEDSCVSGHTWWSCGKYADHNTKKHRVRTCRYTECRQSWQNCVTDNPVCNKSNRKAQGKKCWAEDV